MNGHLIFMTVYLIVALPTIAAFVARRQYEPIKSRGWDMALPSALYGAFMVVCMAVAADLSIEYGAVPCNLVIWPYAPFTCFFLNPYFVRGALLQFNHHWNLEKLRQSKDPQGENRLDWFAKNKNKVSPMLNWAWVWANAILYIAVAAMYEYINVDDPLPGQWLPFNECLAKTRYMVIILAALGTLIIAGYYATFIFLADAFYFKKELLAVLIILPTCFTLWGISVFGGASEELFVAQGTVPIYIVVSTTFIVSIALPLYASIRQARLVSRLKSLGVDTSDTEDNDVPPPLAIVDDKPPKEWSKGSIRGLESPSRPTSPPSMAFSAAAIAGSGLSSAELLGTAAMVLSGGDITAAAATGNGGSSASMVSNSGAAGGSGEDGSADRGSNKSSSKRRSAGSRGARGTTIIPPRTPTSRLFSITLVNDTLRAAFQRYCMESWCIENYLFYRDAVKFRTMNSIFLSFEAGRMSEIYLPTDSTLAVNLPDNIRSRILDRIQKKEVTNNLFEEAEQSVLEFMRNDTFLKWRITDSFVNAWRDANIPPAMLMPGKPVSLLSNDNVNRLVVELGSASQATAKNYGHANRTTVPNNMQRINVTSVVSGHARKPAAPAVPAISESPEDAVHNATTAATTATTEE